MALRCAPCFSHAPCKTGSEALVAVMTMIGFGGGLRVVDGLHGDADLLAHALGELISPTLIASVGENAGDVSDGADGGDLRAGLCSDADDADGLACILARHVFCCDAARRAGAEGSEPFAWMMAASLRSFMS